MKIDGEKLIEQIEKIGDDIVLERGAYIDGILDARRKAISIINDMMKGYRCLICGHSSTAEEWNEEKTKTFGLDSVEIQQMKDRPRNVQYLYKCPHCGVVTNSDNIQEDKE